MSFVRRVPIPQTLGSGLSPFIAESIRRRRLEREQIAALYTAGVHPDPGMSMEEMVAQARSAKLHTERNRRRETRRRAKLAGVRVEKFSRREIIARDRSTCYLCGERVAADEIHLDHVVPLSRGGDHSRANVRVACGTCNIAKGTLTEDEFRAILARGLTRT